MGKRSRKRAGVGGAELDAPGRSSRAARDAARARRAEAVADGADPRPRRRPGRTSIQDRPPAPWGSFPLVELVVLLGIVLIVAGFIVRGSRGGVMLIAGLALGSLGGLELSIREHFGGFRSHTALLAGAVAALAMAIAFFADRHGATPALILPIGAIVFVGAFWLFRQAFARRSGGATFRR
jgi:hypothetical protein